ncbi:putative tetratricopeptide repeat-containing domain protein [Roseburia sp. CAG:197]|jgi:serine/threonine protein phosphatase PrpC|nr:putative tetratricopeptide repeat-containing domain protein [Roseburia sp. CAG:197]
MRKENASFETKFISEAGSYLNNADYFAFVELKDYACYVIADGIDTDDMKKSAQQAVTAVIAKFSDMPGMSKAKLKSYMAEAHRTLLEESAEIRLEASILVLVTDYKKARWAHAGNCRLALLHNGAIIEATKDTSLTQRLADSEEIPLDMVSSHEERNNLYAYLGQPGKFSPVISAKHSLEDGDIILLETRGAWENIGDAELLDATDGVSKAEEVCTGLEDVILSQRLDIIENYTIVSIFVNKIYQNPKQGKYKKLITLLVSLAIALTIALTTILVTRYIMNRKNLEKIDAIKEAGVEKLQEEKYEAAKDKLEEYESISVRVKKGTANYDRVQSVKLYCSLAEDLYDASVNVTSQGYKGAIKDVERATQTLDQLKELGEDTTDLYNTLTAFERYATFMQQGDAFIVENSYGEAVTAYSNASDAVDDFDDTSYKKKAEDALESAQTNDKSAQVNENMNSGMNAEQEGDKLAADGDYTNAKSKYETAKDFYKLAADAGDSKASDKLDSVNIKINDADSSKKESSDGDKLELAIAAETEAREADRNGNHDTAKSKYNEAKQIYQELGNADKVADIEDKIDGMTESKTEGMAVEKMYRAMEYLSKGSFSKARKYLKQAKSIYEQLNDTAHVTQIDEILDNLKQLEKTLGVG